MDKNRIRFLMAALTLIDIIIVSIFLLILSEQSTDKKTLMGASSKTTGDTVFEDVEMESEDSIISEPVVSINYDFQGNYSDSVLDIFQSKIIGKWVISDTMVYEFGEGGTFNGFFDSEHPDIAGYTYYLSMSDSDKPHLFIYNTDNTAMIAYELYLNDIQNIELYFAPADIYIELK